jgi:outer membrane lipoprotein-sorting protein
VKYGTKRKAVVQQPKDKDSIHPLDYLRKAIASMLDRAKTPSGPDPSVKLYGEKTYLVDNLGEREVDGKKAVGLLCRGGREETTIWADPATALPVRVETVISPPPSTNMRPERITMHDFEFNKELEVSLFSTEPPAGYEVEMSKLAPEAKAAEE